MSSARHKWWNDKCTVYSVHLLELLTEAQWGKCLQSTTLGVEPITETAFPFWPLHTTQTSPSAIDRSLWTTPGDPLGCWLSFTELMYTHAHTHTHTLPHAQTHLLMTDELLLFHGSPKCCLIYFAHTIKAILLLSNCCRLLQTAGDTGLTRSAHWLTRIGVFGHCAS